MTDIPPADAVRPLVSRATAGARRQPELRHLRALGLECISVMDFGAHALCAIDAPASPRTAVKLRVDGAAAADHGTAGLARAAGFAATPARAWPGPVASEECELQFCGRECDLAAIGQLFWEMRAC